MNRAQVNKFLMDTLRDRECREKGKNVKNQVNFIRLINELGERNISFVIRYEQPTSCYYLDSQFQLQVASEALKKEYYYGISATMGIATVGQAIKEGCFDDEQGLEALMQRLLLIPDKGFFVDEIFFQRFKTPSRVAKALLARTLLSISLHFGFTLKIRKGDFPNVEKIIKDMPQGRKHFALDEKKEIFYVKGRPSKALLAELPLGYTCEKEGVFVCVCAKGVGNLNDLYASNSSLEIGKLGEYYSGVFPRLKEIDDKKGELYNEKIHSYVLRVERTSYAFSEGINVLSLNAEPLLAPYKADLETFDESEWEVEENFFRACENTEENVLEALNAYLGVSCNVQNIAVSTNIITNDGYLLYGLRAKGGIDEQSFYCSVNGQSELFDKNVEFYQESAYDDCPTIDIKSEKRQDFTQELSRECKAELSLNDFEKEFQYYGISVLGVRNGASERRVHFNVLAEHHTEKSMEEIADRWHNSIEAYENNALYGTKIQLVKNKRTFWGGCIKKLIAGFLKSEEILEVFVAVFVGLLTLVRRDSQPAFMDAIGIVVSILLAVNLLIKGYDFLRNWQKRKRYFSWVLEVDHPGVLYELYESVSSKMIKKADKNKKRRARKEKERVETETTLSPIAVIMTALYVRSLQKKNK